MLASAAAQAFQLGEYKECKERLVQLKQPKGEGQFRVVHNELLCDFHIEGQTKAAANKMLNKLIHLQQQLNTDIHEEDALGNWKWSINLRFVRIINISCLFYFLVSGDEDKAIEATCLSFNIAVLFLYLKVCLLKLEWWRVGGGSNKQTNTV